MATITKETINTLDERIARLEYVMDQVSFSIDETNKIITDMQMKIDKLESIYGT